MLKSSKANYMPPQLFLTENDIYSCVLKYHVFLPDVHQESHTEMI